MIKSDTVSFCAPIVARDLLELKCELKKCNGLDLIEIRRDYLDANFDDALIKKELSDLKDPTEVIFTYRSSDEGGQSSADDETRFKTILKYLQANINYIDVEEGHVCDFLKALDSDLGKIKLIVSYHNFKQTPNRQEILFQLEKNSKYADIVKVAYKINSQADINNLSWASSEFRKKHPGMPLIIIGMGEKGIATRIFPELVGSNLSFAPVSSNSSAPGQVNLNCLKGIRVSANEKEKTRIFNWSDGLWKNHDR